MVDFPDEIDYQNYQEEIHRVMQQQGFGEVLEDDSEKDPFEKLSPEQKREVLDDKDIQLDFIAMEKYGERYPELSEEEQSEVETMYTQTIFHSNGVGSAGPEDVGALGHN